MLVALSWATQCAAQSYGAFVGKVVTEWLDDGRRMKLVEPFAYVDAVGVRWDAPSGSVVDGASIPRVAWSIIGGPFEGIYRNASVIHDVACDQRRRPWPDVHRAFYTAMLASEVDPIKAKVMYAAVYQFGPRWERQVNVADVPLKAVGRVVGRLRDSASTGEQVEAHASPIPRHGCPEGGSCKKPRPLPPNAANVTVVFRPLPLSLKSEDFAKLRAFIEANNPSLDAIDVYRP